LAADSKELSRARGCGVREVLELAIELEEFAVQLAKTVGKAGERELCGLPWFVDSRGVGAQLSAQSGFRLQCAGAA